MYFVVTMFTIAIVGFLLASIGVVKSNASPLWDAVTTCGMYAWLICTIIGVVTSLLMQVVAG